jgi:pilus assembly protein CpaF
VNGERIGLIDDPAQLAEAIRRDYGAQLPPAQPRESQRERELRQEKTKFVLETEVMPCINEARVRAGNPVLSVEDEDRVVELILSAMFLLPYVLGILAAEPLAEDFVAIGNGNGRVDRADGTIKLYPPLVSEDAGLERVIADVAEAHHRPFNFEHPWVDVQLSDRLRFHGQGFDVVRRPAVFIRVHRVLGARIPEFVEAGTMSAGIGYLLETVVPQAGLSVAFSGVQKSGKTTLLRASALAYPDETRMTTVETDFELGIAGLGRPWVHEMQARLPVTSKDRGITSAELMPPVLRTGCEVSLVGEVRGDEGAPAIRAANIGVGSMVTVHGYSAAAGLEQLVDRLAETGIDRETARRMVYQAFDLVVHCTMTRDRRRFVSEVVHPLVEGDRPKIHTLYEPSAHGADGRARATATVWPAQLLHKVHMNFPGFDERQARDDRYRPLGRLGVPDPARNGEVVTA